MRPIRTLVVDDEPLARTRLVKLLSGESDIMVLDECRNGSEALEKIRKYQPDLIFLDIQMPDLDGFHVLEKGKLKHKPFIIFVTAYDHYALKAFDVKATDYLLKPYDDERFYKALDYARSQIITKDQKELHSRLVNLIEDFNQKKNPDILVYLDVKERGTDRRIRIEDILWINAYGNYVELHLSDQRHLLRVTLQQLEEKLNPYQFIRIHRSIVVNKNYVTKVKYLSNNQYQFTMRTGMKLKSSRSYKKAIGEFLIENKF
jgi:two-component system LytT family response regulator